MSHKTAVIICLFLYLTFGAAVVSLRSHGCSPLADVIFILDGSESITRMDFNKTKEYVRREVDNLNVFPDGANVGIITYSDRVSDIVSFRDHRDVAELERAIAGIIQPRLGTNTAAALREARVLFQTQGRPAATKIAVIITDGDTRNREPPRQEASRLRNDGVNVIAIGVGKDVVETELDAMASQPNYVKKVEDFAGLDILKLPYQEVCPVSTPASSPGGPDDLCEINGNVIFIFDGSESISMAEEMIMKQFIKEQIDLLKLGDGKAGMGLVMFSNDATIEIRLSNTISSGRLKSEVDALKLPSSGSNIASGIQVMTRMFESYGNPDRPRIAVLITDGVSMDKTETERIASDAKRQGIEMVAIGVGSPDQIDVDELSKIASRRDLVFTPETFDQFASTEYFPKLSVGRKCGDEPTTPLWTTTPTRTTRWTTTAPWTTTRRTTTPWTTTRRTTTPWTTSRRTTPWTTTRRTTTPWTTTRRTATPWTTRRRTTTRIWSVPTTTTPRPSSSGPVTSPAIGQPSTPNPIIGRAECENCRIRYGAGFGWVNGTCEKFVRCVLQPLSNGSYLAVSSVVFDCPRGLFWDQKDTLTCRYPNEVDCPFDKCRLNPNLKAYGDPSDCGVYWRCVGGYSTGKFCCAPNFSFDESRGECVSSSSCYSFLCQPGAPGGPCHFTANLTDETSYNENSSGGVITRKCPAGLAFTQETCGCHKTMPIKTKKPEGCQPDVYLPFDNDVLDHSGWNRGVGHSGVEIEAVSDAVGNGAARFDGTDMVWIYRYNNIEFPKYVEIRFRFRGESSQTSPEALVTNGNCGEKPSLAISSTRSDVTFLTETDRGEKTTRVSNRNGWTDVKYVYDRTRMSGTLGTSTQSADQTGVIRRTHSPLILGHGHGFRNFTGYIDEFYVYFCNPDV